MKPVTFSCPVTSSLTPQDISQRILDVANWTTFRGFGPIPGIRHAEFEVATPAVVGSRIRVVNTDGSTHVEEIVDWQPDRRVELRMCEFSPPLSKLASGFDEVWTFERVHDTTHVVRAFELHPKSVPARIVLLVIAFLLRRAIDRHMNAIR